MLDGRVERGHGWGWIGSVLIQWGGGELLDLFGFDEKGVPFLLQVRIFVA